MHYNPRLQWPFPCFQLNIKLARTPLVAVKGFHCNKILFASSHRQEWYKKCFISRVLLLAWCRLKWYKLLPITPLEVLLDNVKPVLGTAMHSSNKLYRLSWHKLNFLLCDNYQCLREIFSIAQHECKGASTVGFNLKTFESDTPFSPNKTGLNA